MEAGKVDIDAEEEDNAPPSWLASIMESAGVDVAYIILLESPDPEKGKRRAEPWR